MQVTINLHEIARYGVYFTIWLSICVVLYHGALFIIDKASSFKTKKDRKIEKLTHRINLLTSVNNTLQEDNVNLKLQVKAVMTRELELLNDHKTVTKRNRILSSLLREDYDMRKTQQLKNTAFGKQTTELDIDDLITE